MKKTFIKRLVCNLFLLIFLNLGISSAQNYAISLPGGSDGSVSNVALPAFNLTYLPVTIEAWYYPISKNDYGAVLYYRGASTNGGVQYDKWTNDKTLRGIDPGANAVIASNAPSYNAWNHIAYVVTTSGMTIYINGIKTSSTTAGTAFTFDGGTYIGWDAAVANRTIQGYFDEVRIWNTARTETELNEFKYQTLDGDETGLVAYYNFDDQATVATDSSANGYNGTINGGSYIESFDRTDTDGDGIPDLFDNCVYTANPNQEDSNNDGIGDACVSDIDGDGILNESDNCPKTPNAGQEDADGDGIGDVCDPNPYGSQNYAMSMSGSDGNSSNINISGLNLNSSTFTIEMWVKPNGEQNPNSGLLFNSNNYGLEYTSNWQRDAYTLRIMAPSGQGDQYAQLSESPYISSDEWHHVVVVVTDNSRAIYVDGKKDEEEITDAGTFSYDFTTGSTYLGWDPNGNDRAYYGLMDEIRVWNYARSIEEIKNDKLTVLNGNENGLVAYYNFDDKATTATDLTSNANNGTITGGTYVESTLFDTMTYVQSTATKMEGLINSNSSDNAIMSLNIETDNFADPFNLSNLVITVGKTSSVSDISSIKVYATENDEDFSTDALIAEINGTLENDTIKINCDYDLVYGDNYFWITYNIADNATKGDTVDATCIQFTLSDSIYTVSTSSTEGTITIDPDAFINNVKFDYNVVTYTGETTTDGSNFASFQQNAVMTYNGYQYATYWNNNYHVCIARKKIPNGEWEEVEFTDYTSTASRIADNHYTISMGICKNDGTVHVAFDHHNDNLNYRISDVDLANDPENVEWSTSSFSNVRDYLQVGRTETNFTYPRFISKPDGDLLYECRIGWSGDGDDYLWEYKGETGKWTYLGEYLNGTDANENAYINGIQYDSNGRLHVSWVWRQTPDAQTNHDINYIYSNDDGRTWYNTAGTKIGTISTNPVKMSSSGIKIWTVPTQRGLINQESQCADSKSGIHMLNSYIPEGAANNGFWTCRRTYGEMHHIYQDEKGDWQNDVIGPTTGDRGEIGVDEGDNLYVIIPDHAIYFASAANKWQNWTAFDISETSTSAAEPILDRDALLKESVLSFICTHRDLDGKIITPNYLLDKSNPGTGTGVNLSVYSDADFSVFEKQKLDSININPDSISSANDMVGIIYEGTLETEYAEAYTLYLTTSGNTKMYINDKLVITTGDLSSANEFETTLELKPTHKYDIRIESIYKTSGTITCTLEWSSKSQTKVIVPTTALYGELKDIIPDGIEENKTDDNSSYIECLPNPFKSSFTVNINGSFDYSIYNLQGTLIESGNADSQTAIGKKLNSGVYLINISQQGKPSIRRVIKK